nr:RNA polymerase sigma-70 factor [uncultured Draconibacterium sp.]
MSIIKRNKEYLEGLKNGNEKVFRLIIDHWYSKLFNFAIGFLNNEENAKEVIQDVFLLLWEHRFQLNENTVLNAYLFTLTRNHCIDIIRREKLTLQFRKDKQDEYKRLSESYNALSDKILDNIFVEELQNEINNAINSLPNQCKKIFILSRQEGLKNREISEKLNLSLKTVEAHITKAIRQIRAIIEQKYSED